MERLQKGIRVPGRNGLAYGWHSLAVGEYGVWPATEQDRIRQAASTYKRRHAGWGYTTRLIGDTIKLWRTA